MEQTLRALLTTWDWRPDVLFVLVALGVAYTIGWRRLRKRRARVARSWRLLLYLAGLGTGGLALLSAIDALAPLLLLMHMLQHELLIMVAPPLLLLADPLPVILWGLPRLARRAVGRWLGRGAPLRRVLEVATGMPVAWGAFAVNLWAWHIPALYEAALSNGLLHNLEHLTFFGAAVFFWWPIINPAPRLHGRWPYGVRIAYVLAGALQITALGFLIVVPQRVVYPSYAAAPRVWGLSPLDDQVLGGGIMSESGMMFLLPLLVLVHQWLNEEERQTRRLESIALKRRGATPRGFGPGGSPWPSQSSPSVPGESPRSLGRAKGPR